MESYQSNTEEGTRGQKSPTREIIQPPTDFLCSMFEVCFGAVPFEAKAVNVTTGPMFLSVVSMSPMCLISYRPTPGRTVSDSFRAIALARDICLSLSSRKVYHRYKSLRDIYISQKKSITKSPRHGWISFELGPLASWLVWFGAFCQISVLVATSCCSSGRSVRF